MREEESRCASFSDGEQCMIIGGPEAPLREAAGNVAARLWEGQTHAAEMDRFNRNAGYAGLYRHLEDHPTRP